MTAPMNGISVECVGMCVNVGWADGTSRHGVIVNVEPMPADHALADRFSAFVTVRFPAHLPDPRSRAWLN